MQKQVRKLEQIPEHLPASRYFIAPATYTTLICSTLMYETLAWSGSSTLSPICFAFKWASLLLRFYFSQALSPVVSAAAIYSLKSALHQSERNLHIPGLLKFLSSFRKANPTNTKQAPKNKQTIKNKTKQNKKHTQKNPSSLLVLRHCYTSLSPSAFFWLFQYSIFLHSDEGLSVTVVSVLPLFLLILGVA